MAEVFFSYSSEDRPRVKRVHEALSAEGFEVFWDQAVPPGKSWDAWIREKLQEARVVVVFWSKASVRSDNVAHEAVLAKQAGKLVPAMLEDVPGSDFPMGLFIVQAARLDRIGGDPNHPEWQKLLVEIETKVMPPYAARRIAMRDAELRAMRSKTEHALGRQQALEAELAKALASAHGQDTGSGTLRIERDQARAEVGRLASLVKGLQGEVAGLSAARSEAEAKLAKAATAGSGGRGAPWLSRVVAGLAIAGGIFMGFLWQDADGSRRYYQSEYYNLQSSAGNAGDLQRQLNEATDRENALRGENDRLKADIASLQAAQPASAPPAPAIAEPQPAPATIQPLASLPASFEQDPAVVQAASGFTFDQVNSRGDDYYFGRNGYTQDKAEAAKWYRYAVNLGQTEAMYNLGFMYMNGEGGVPLDGGIAVELYRRAEAAGNATGTYGLATAYRFGQGGLTASDAEAARLFQLAYDRGNRDALYHLAVMYENGQGGLNRSSEAAARHIYAAVKRGVQRALDEVKSNSSAWSAEFRSHLQSLLAGDGFYKGSIDGVLGSDSLAALDSSFNTNYAATPY